MKIRINESFFKFRDGLNPIQIVIVIVCFTIGNNIESGWGVFFKLAALFFLINLFRTISWWLKGYM